MHYLINTFTANDASYYFTLANARRLDRGSNKKAGYPIEYSTIYIASHLFSVNVLDVTNMSFLLSESNPCQIA